MREPVSVYLRAIDASANRAREALRVIEDFVRFIQDDAFLVKEFKTLRHRLVQNVRKFPMDQRLTFRETLADVGTQIATRSEFQRSSLQEILDANFSRLQEALRSLEEFSKLTKPDAAHEFEQMRYASYTLQRTVFFTISTDSQRRKTLRQATGGKLIPRGERLWQIADLSIASDWTMAMNGDCEGFLITPDSPETVKSARNLLAPETLVGVWISAIDDVSQRLLEGVDFLAGPENILNDLKKQTAIPVLELDYPASTETPLP